VRPTILIYFSNANLIISSNILEYSNPVCSHNLGYILISVNPGNVFISFIYISSVSSFTKKSTLANPFPSIALNAFIAVLLTLSDNSLLIFAGIVSFDSEFLYLASNV